MRHCSDTSRSRILLSYRQGSVATRIGEQRSVPSLDKLLTTIQGQTEWLRQSMANKWSGFCCSKGNVREGGLGTYATIRCITLGPLDQNPDTTLRLAGAIIAAEVPATSGCG
jgi:hypothetical protein